MFKGPNLSPGDDRVPAQCLVGPTGTSCTETPFRPDGVLHVVVSGTWTMEAVHS